MARLGEYYTPDAQFKDPFNQVQGVTQVQRIFGHMFDALAEPRFVVHDILVEGDQCFLTWDFLFRFRRFGGELQTVHGSSHLRLAGRRPHRIAPRLLGRRRRAVREAARARRADALAEEAGQHLSAARVLAPRPAPSRPAYAAPRYSQPLRRKYQNGVITLTAISASANG